MNVLIVEDEPRAAGTLKELIESVRPQVRVTGICSSIDETVRVLASDPPDLLFMDVELADGNCFEIFKKITVDSPVVFCTAHDEYMLDAFRANAIEYLLKPVDERAVHLVFEKVDTLTRALSPNMLALSDLLTAAAPVGQPYNSAFLVHFREKMIPILVADIAAISFEHEACQLYTFKNKKHPLFKTMDEVEAALDPAQFFRISRQVIVCRSAIVNIEPHFNRKVSLTLTNQLAERPVVSRLKVTPFLSWVEKG